MELVIFIGLQATGKTSFYQENFAKTHLLLSKDLWPNSKSPQARLVQLLEHALQEKKAVVVDNTNPEIADRKPLMILGKKYEAYIIGFFFSSTLDEARKRNENRIGKKRVPEVAFFSTLKKLQPPTKAEGFDELWQVTILNNKFQINELS